MTEQWILGVIASIFGSVILATITWLTKNYLLPVIKIWRRDVIKVAGNWTIYYKKQPTTAAGNMTIKQ